MFTIARRDRLIIHFYCPTPFWILEALQPELHLSHHKYLEVNHRCAAWKNLQPCACKVVVVVICFGKACILSPFILVQIEMLGGTLRFFSELKRIWATLFLLLLLPLLLRVSSRAEGGYWGCCPEIGAEIAMRMSLLGFIIYQLSLMFLNNGQLIVAFL